MMSSDPGTIRVGPLSVDVQFGIVSAAGGRYRLTGEAAKVLVLLARRPGHVFSACDIVAVCCLPSETAVSIETVARNRISSCRSALRRIGAADMLHNVHGAGYSLRVPPGGRRLSEAQDHLLDDLLASHPDQQAVFRFRLAEFQQTPHEVAAVRADFAANGIRLEAQALS